MSVPLADGTPSTIAADIVGPQSIAIDDTFAFASGSPIEVESTPLVRAPLDGTSPTVTMVKAVGPGDFGTHQVAVDGSYVYYTARDSVYRVQKGYSP